MRILVEAVLNILLHWGQFSLREDKQYLPLPGSVCFPLRLQGTPFGGEGGVPQASLLLTP